MDRFQFKIIGVLFLEMVCTVMIMTLLTIGIYWILYAAGIPELGYELPFKIGLTAAEVALSVYCMNEVNEDLFDEDD